MMNSLKKNDREMNENIITTIYPDSRWLIRQKKITIILLAVFGIVVFILSVIYQGLVYALIRGLIFLIACFIIYYKSDSLIRDHIIIQRDGKIIIKKGFIKKVINYNDLGNIQWVKEGNYWLIGEKRIKVSFETYPDLDKKIEALKSKN